MGARDTTMPHSATTDDRRVTERTAELGHPSACEEHESRAIQLPVSSALQGEHVDPEVSTAFLIGPPRCGTTLLGYLLGGGQDVMSLSEPFLAYAIYDPPRLRKFFLRLERKEGLKRLIPPDRADPEAFLNFLQSLAQGNGLRRLVIKETYRQDQAWDNVRMLNWIASGPHRVAAITRHPYDAAVSTLKFCRWWRGAVGHVIRLWAPGLPLFRNDEELTEYFAVNWCGFVRWCQARELPLTRYEDLVTEPENELRRVCELCEIPFDSAMLDHAHPRAAFGGIGSPDVMRRSPRPVSNASVGRRDRLAAPLRDIIESRCAEAAAGLGYAL